MGFGIIVIGLDDIICLVVLGVVALVLLVNILRDIACGCLNSIKGVFSKKAHPMRQSSQIDRKQSTVP